MEILLGLGSAVTYGAADFVGGLVSRRAPVLTVVFGSQLLGTVALGAALLFVPLGTAGAGALGWGALAGVAGSAGVIGLYHGLSVGRMSVVAPVTAVVAASVPVVYGIGSGERPSVLALTGVVVALFAVALVSRSSDVAERPRRGRLPGQAGLVAALGAGVAFGAFFILLRAADAGSGLWPLVASRAASLLGVGALAAIGATRLRPPPGTLRYIAGAGVLDVSANVLYLLAARRGLLSLVAVLTSMYPASTVVLARVFLRERLTPPRLAGLAAAAAGVALIAFG